MLNLLLFFEIRVIEKNSTYCEIIKIKIFFVELKFKLIQGHENFD